jgi:signal peptidase II
MRDNVEHHSAQQVPHPAGWRSRRALWGYAIALGVIVLDQWTKQWASAELVYRVPVEVTGFFNLMLAHNTGAAFSFLADAGGWQRWFFTGVATLVSLVMVVWLARLAVQQVWLATALGLILGGGLGNLWDRIAYGYVVDFISLHYQSYYWPAFNIADSAISLGAAILVADSLFSKNHTQTGESA